MIALTKLMSPPSMESLLDLVRWLDLECAEAEPESLQLQILARSIIAAGREFAKRRMFPADHPIVKTIHAAEAYVLDPAQDRLDSYYAAATASYPYGSGEGCYAVAELGYPGCQPGSGCASGAGSLYSLAHDLGVDDLWRGIAKDLVPWLQGESDPVASLLRSR